MCPTTKDTQPLIYNLEIAQVDSHILLLVVVIAVLFLTDVLYITLQ